MEGCFFSSFLFFLSPDYGANQSSVIAVMGLKNIKSSGTYIYLPGLNRGATEATLEALKCAVISANPSV